MKNHAAPQKRNGSFTQQIPRAPELNIAVLHIFSIEQLLTGMIQQLISKQEHQQKFERPACHSNTSYSKKTVWIWLNRASTGWICKYVLDNIQCLQTYKTVHIPHF